MGLLAKVLGFCVELALDHVQVGLFVAQVVQGLVELLLGGLHVVAHAVYYELRVLVLALGMGEASSQ